MAVKRGGLGKGLDSLIADKVGTGKGAMEGEEFRKAEPDKDVTFVKINKENT